ncbi:DUF1684 domain-containing protein [Pseudonocardia sp. MH-G8]|uniref:DUF1684 domain-containing protein n=1 Tax=Pseudonocardia sp. MH-G8 TaxID=1854588 RepID=UPI000B9FE5ED|nr:DUF1684 domain-containing protein [Pseudonocardia sp. MH-G8]OZM75783.1 hypothetical protein CFP66_44355 [Pseudonocardia sp. MH-G8]
MSTGATPTRDDLADMLYDLLALTTLEPLPAGAPITGLPGRWSPRPDGERGARVELTDGEHILVDGVARTGVVDVDLSDPRTSRSDALALDAQRRIVVWWFPDASGGQVWVGMTTESAPRLRDFQGISTYPVDDGWRIPVSFTRVADDEQLPSVERFSTGESTPVERVGWFEAVIDGEPYRFAVDRNPRYAYVEFRDAGSGVESYAATRAVRIFDDPADVTVLDFNDAVVPSCAFNPRINCPLPPRGNWIHSVVRAGQRDVLFAPTATDEQPAPGPGS